MPLRESFRVDLRFAWQSLTRHRGFTIVVVAILALGIGATAMMYGVTAGVLLRPLPFAHPEQIVMVWGSYPSTNLGFSEQPLDGRLVETLRANRREFQSISAFMPHLYNLGDAASAARLDGAQVTSEFFTTIGVTPVLGRGFTPDEEVPGRDHVVVIGWRLWQQRFRGDVNVLGRTVTLSAEPFTIVGVAPKGFAFPRGAEMPGDFEMPESTQLWTPMKPPPGGESLLAGVARVKPGVTIADAQRDLDRMSRLQEEMWPRGKGWFNTRAIPLHAQIVGDLSKMLVSLLGAAMVLMLIACVNTAQLLLASLEARRRELSIRAALGASMPRLARILLIETMLMTAAGGILGGLGAWIGMSLVRKLGPGRLPQLANVTFDSRVVGVVLALTAVTAVLVGVGPALRASRVDLTDMLRQAGRSSGQKALSVKARRTLVGAQVALSVTLAIGSVLLVRSLVLQLGGDLGFTAPHALTFEVTLPALTYPERQLPAIPTNTEHARAVRFIDDALRRIRALPGVNAAAVGKPLPMSGAQEATVFFAEGADARLWRANGKPMVEYTIASPGLFATLGSSIVAGRDFAGADGAESPHVLIVNQSMARWLWPGESPIGKRLHLGVAATASPWMTVIGVTADMKRYSLTEAPRPEMFVPYTQNPYPSFATMQFIVRSAADPAAVIAPIRRAVASIDPSIPVARVRTVDELVRDATTNARFAALGMSAFAVVALSLSMIGLYGVTAFTVHRRRSEFGLRAALGATRRQLLQIVLIDGLALAGGGAIAGIALAVAGGRVLQSMLYQVSVGDPFVLIAVGLLVLATTALACAIPAVRASGVDPRSALDAV